MEARLEKLIKAFEDNGWTTIGAVDISSDWWFEDIIQLVSKWRPTGINIYLTLLTDPMYLRKKVGWCIAISFEMPTAKDFKWIEQITLNDIKRENLDLLVQRVNNVVLNSEK